MNREKKINLNEQKEIQLAILNEVKRICDDNNINYFLGGGTLLGAIRHKGYIPWDDDIDIMMPREDYEKLQAVFNQQCDKSKYKLLSYKNTQGFYYPFIKIVDVRTKLMEFSCKEVYDMGIYIDVFSIDFLPDDDKKIRKLYKKYKILKKILDIYKLDKKDSITKSKIKLMLKKPIKWIVGKFRIYRLILRSIDELGIEYKNTNKVACISGIYFEKEIMPSDYISDYILVDFEGEKYKAPIGYDEYLTKHYGDYMKLPPKEKQVSNHDNVAYWRENN